MSRHRILLALTLVFTIVIDQITKLIAKGSLPRGMTYTYLGDLFRLQYAENPGAFLSLGAGLSHGARFWIFSVAVGIFLLGATYVLFSRKVNPLAAFALALVVGGGVGNLIDRVSYGFVFDFMNMGIGNLRTGIFNVADMAIMAGVGMLFLDSFLHRNAEKGQNSEEAAKC